MTYKQHFSRSVGRQGAPLHFAAHSHHPWPDVTHDAQQEYWHDSSNLLDKKWGKIFAETIPQAQAHIARHLSLPDPNTIAFAPNTHTLLQRLLSATHGLPKHNILTTDSEFHSFTRQMARLEEDELVNVVRVPVEPFASFKQRFTAELKARDDWDIVWLSHVFFNSGQIVAASDLHDIIAAIEDKSTFAVIDGYHAFMAIPVDLSKLGARVFYLAGGYKYAMAGEGVCFMHCPQGYGERPRDTGWFAEFGSLEKARGKQVGYATDASRFAGATFDPSGLYRFNAVMDWLRTTKLGVEFMHAYCKTLQRTFIEQLDASRLSLNGQKLISRDLKSVGRFLTFRTPDAAHIDEELSKQSIVVDHRDDRLRIGFGIYQTEGDVTRLVDACRRILP